MTSTSSSERHRKMPAHKSQPFLDLEKPSMNCNHQIPKNVAQDKLRLNRSQSLEYDKNTFVKDGAD